ncbi:unnamed protein product [Paramecium octaurelia]|uniref:RING-type domain-containing protein n=1 Tax=Paramecium octaurelia TaxID=43137 RepID=A0A8S1RZ17_PAROT|nr:unnamed protein product [Paramecium octaurelia]
MKGNDRPIKMNPSGKYNLDFIDWNNEWAAVYTNGYRHDGKMDQCPIQGMSLETFNRLISDEFERFEFEQEDLKNEENKLEEQFVGQIKKMKMGKSSKNCSICIKDFAKGEIIMKLPCNHIFHEDCIVPWFQKASKCPNCKFDVKEHFKSQQQ